MILAGALSWAWTAAAAATAPAPSEPETLTVASCVALARSQAPLSVAAALDERAAALDSTSTAFNRRPDFFVAAGAMVAPEWSYDPAFTNLGEYRAQVGIDWTVSDGGRRQRARERTRYDVEGARARRVLASRDAGENAATGALQWLRLTESAAILRERRGGLVGIGSLVRAAVRSGIRSPADSIRLGLAEEDAALDEELNAAGTRTTELQLLEIAGRGLRPRPRDPAAGPRTGARADAGRLDRAVVGRAPPARGRAARSAESERAARGARGAPATAPEVTFTVDAGLAGTDLTRAVPQSLLDAQPSATFTDRLDRDLGASAAVTLRVPIFDSRALGPRSPPAPPASSRRATPVGRGAPPAARGGDPVHPLAVGGATAALGRCGGRPRRVPLPAHQESVRRGRHHAVRPARCARVVPGRAHASRGGARGSAVRAVPDRGSSMSHVLPRHLAPAVVLLMSIASCSRTRGRGPGRHGRAPRRAGAGGDARSTLVPRQRRRAGPLAEHRRPGRDAHRSPRTWSPCGSVWAMESAAATRWRSWSRRSPAPRSSAPSNWWRRRRSSGARRRPSARCGRPAATWCGCRSRRRERNRGSGTPWRPAHWSPEGAELLAMVAAHERWCSRRTSRCASRRASRPGSRRASRWRMVARSARACSRRLPQTSPEDQSALVWLAPREARVGRPARSLRERRHRDRRAAPGARPSPIRRWSRTT